MYIQTLLQQKRMNRMLISALEDLAREAKQAKGFFYPQCTPDTIEGQIAFANYKDARKALVNIQKDLKQLRQCQREVKDEIKQKIYVERVIRELATSVFDFSDENEA